MMEYATTAAVFSANRIGLTLSLGSWREIFLAITDKITGEDRSTVTAEYVGKVRDGGERWRVKTPTRGFDVIYDPHLAKVVLVIRPPSDPAPADLPDKPRPLRGKIAERIMADA